MQHEKNTAPQEPLTLTPEAFEETARVITYQWMRHVGHGYEDVEHYEQLLDDEVALHEEATDYAAVEELKATTELVVFVMEQLVSLAEFTAIERRRARDDAAELRALLNHPLLNKLMGELEDHSTGRWWGMAEEWMDLRDAALAATEGQA